jgi:hypothetical protein
MKQPNSHTTEHGGKVQAELHRGPSGHLTINYNRHQTAVLLPSLKECCCEVVPTM